MLGATVVAAALAAAGCGGGGVDEAASTPTTAEPSTTSEPVSPPTSRSDEQAVLAAYQGYWDTWLAANDPPNPDHPDLARYATGAALAKVRESIEQHRLDGTVVRLPSESVWGHQPRLESLGGSRAVVTDCVVDDSQLVDADTGLVLNDEVGTLLSQAVVLLDDGLWRVETVDSRAQWSGVAGCAGSS